MLRRQRHRDVSGQKFPTINSPFELKQELFLSKFPLQNDNFID